MIPLRQQDGARTLVVGFGRSGAATARALAAGGATVAVWDDSPDMRQQAAGAGFALADPARVGAAGYTLVAVSPGVAAGEAAAPTTVAAHPVVAAARRGGAVVDNDIGLFFAWLADRASAPQVVGVTGTNGKSTTTALIAHLLTGAGIAATAAGNIGRPVLALDPALPWRAIILELSSFQLEVARRLAPDVAVFLNLTEDHLDRHGTMERYVAAKERLFAGSPRHCVVGIEEAAGRRLARRLAGTAALDVFGDADVFGAAGGFAGLASGCAITGSGYRHLVDGRQRGWHRAAEGALRGGHNLRNEVAAFLVAARMGPGIGAIRAGLHSFAGLPHRLERVGVRAGVEYVNDSKATNPVSAARALAATERIRWIAGGRPKPGGFASLQPYLGRVRRAYLIGEAADELAAALAGRAPHQLCGDLEAAFAAASGDAGPGDTVLLSPACASFDQFADFAARGECFRRLWAALPAPACRGDR